ncbi:MAG: SIS domain-containing protein [Acidimicrobiales bacterium]
MPIVATGARCPAWVGAATLAILLDLPRATTRDAGALRETRDAGSRVVVVTSGDALVSRSAALGISVVPVDPEAGPAAGLGVSIVPVLVLLERLRLVDGMSPAVSSVASQLQARHAALDADLGAVEALARVLPGRVAIVTGAGAMGKHAARRWVQEIDRVGGVAAVRRRLPTGPVDVETGVRLSEATTNGAQCSSCCATTSSRTASTAASRLVDDAFAEVHTFTAAGDGPLAQLLDLVLQGDAVAAAVVRQTGA